MGGKRHSPAVLPPGETPCPLKRRLVEPQDRSGRVRKISLPPLRVGIQTVPRTYGLNKVKYKEVGENCSEELQNYRSLSNNSTAVHSRMVK